MPDVQTVQLDTEWVKRLHAMLELLRRVVLLTAGLLGVGVVLIVGNTIRLDILNRRAEIEVMKLVGASDGFARRPFLYGGVWYGLGGGLGALILVAAATAVLARPVEHLALLYGSAFRIAGPRCGLGRGSSRRGGEPVLGGFLACCDATYPGHRTVISICFLMISWTRELPVDISTLTPGVLLCPREI